MIELRHLSTGYGTHIVAADLNARLKEGELTSLLGPNGVGKSTLLNALIPDAGMEIGELSDRLGRGRHTTRHSEIFFLELLEPACMLWDPPENIVRFYARVCRDRRAGSIV